VAFDFDGVIADSIRERGVTAWNAYQSFLGNQECITSPNDMPPEFAEYFSTAGRYVRTIDENLAVLKNTAGTIVTQQDFESAVQALLKDERLRFIPHFIEARKRFKTKNRELWLGLHRIYPGIITLMKSLFSICSFYIVTGKDEQSVRDILEPLHIDIPRGHIYGGEQIENKSTALAKICRKEHVLPAELSFLDDNVTHLPAPLNSGYDVMLAGWGYGMPEHFSYARKAGIPIVDIRFLIDRVDRIHSTYHDNRNSR